MKIVIDIPENTYRRIQALARNGYFEHDICGNSMQRIANGTPLQKGHGRLIDANELNKCIVDRITMPYVPLNKIQDAPTIIEADKERE